MTDKDRESLRKWFETGVRMSEAGLREVFLHGEYRFKPETGLLKIEGRADEVLPPLTTAQQLALSVLLGEPDTAVLSALCDCLIEQGHEYAVAVAEKSRREERERIAHMVESIAGHDHHDDDTPPRLYDVFNTLMTTAKRIRSGEHFVWEWGV